MSSVNCLSIVYTPTQDVQASIKGENPEEVSININLSGGGFVNLTVNVESTKEIGEEIKKALIDRSQRNPISADKLREAADFISNAVLVVHATLEEIEKTGGTPLESEWEIEQEADGRPYVVFSEHEDERVTLKTGCEEAALFRMIEGVGETYQFHLYEPQEPLEGIITPSHLEHYRGIGRLLHEGLSRFVPKEQFIFPCAQVNTPQHTPRTITMIRGMNSPSRRARALSDAPSYSPMKRIRNISNPALPSFFTRNMALLDGVIKKCAEAAESWRLKYGYQDMKLSSVTKDDVKDVCEQIRDFMQLFLEGEVEHEVAKTESSLLYFESILSQDLDGKFEAHGEVQLKLNEVKEEITRLKESEETDYAGVIDRMDQLVKALLQ